jgi:hypothetical protein
MFLMLGGEIMEAMTWVLASTYEANRVFLDALNCKSYVRKKTKMHGSK